MRKFATPRLNKTNASVLSVDKWRQLAVCDKTLIITLFITPYKNYKTRRHLHLLTDTLKETTTPYVKLINLKL